MKNIILLLIAFLSFSTISFAQTVSVSSPAAGANVSSPVRFAATANGGGHPVTAMRIYVDNQSMYTVYTNSLNTNLALPSGGHSAVVVAWNSIGQSFTSSLNINVGNPAPTNGGIAVSSPANGATVASPVGIVASATPASGRVITAMRIYVDSSSVYVVNAQNLNTAVNMNAGGHSVVVQAWDNTGAVYKDSLVITVGSPNPTPGPYQNNLTATAKWMAANSMAPDGAILYGSSQINPYYSNLAAIGLTKDPGSYVIVQKWMEWYITHLNWPDKWGLYGTTYDYDYNNGTAASHNDADSTDSYAATFLSLAWAYYSTGDAGAQSYVRTLSYQLDAIGGVIVQTQQSDGLTWAKPDYQIKYLMDNCEAYRGLRDLALIFQNAFGDTAKAQYYNAKADLMLQGINGMWMNGSWAVYKDGVGNLAAPNYSVWYADATSQLFPVMQGVIAPNDARSVQVYSKFNAAWPGWPTLSFNAQDSFPWVMIADAAAVMGDTNRVNTYINSIQSKYVATGFPWPWYNMEAGWFMRLNAYMMGKRPL
ncbi:MAG: hypothetical protein DMG67_02425 [Acidobacteria bacterium]|nr:MAG: hypothetical protein DMG67_02425 [Acidobacteriota bacterium]